MASLGGGKSESQQTSQGSTFVDPSQQGFLNLLRQQGAGLLQNQFGGGFAQQAQQRAGALSDQAQQFTDQFSQGAQGLLGGQQQQQQAAQQAIQGGGAGQDFLQGAIAQGNPFLNQQVQNLGQQIGQNFQEQILPGIRRNAVQVGGLGGGRQGVAEGIAAEGAQRAFTQGAAGLQAQNFQQQLGAANQFQQNQLSGLLGGGQLAGQGVGQQQGFGQAGLAGLGQQFGLQQGGVNAAFNPLQQFAGILGGPTVLSQNQGQGTSSAFNFNAGVG